MIDVYVLRPSRAGAEALVLRRAEGGRSPKAANDVAVAARVSDKGVAGVCKCPAR